MEIVWNCLHPLCPHIPCIFIVLLYFHIWNPYQFIYSYAVAKTVLWEDAKQTVTVLLLLAVIYYHLFTCGYTFITAMAKLLSLTAMFLFIHGMLPSNLYSPLFSFSFVEFTYYQMINWYLDLFFHLFHHSISLSVLIYYIFANTL